MNDVLRVTYDNSPPDTPTLLVFKEDGLSTYCVAEFRNDEAIEMYNKLNQGNPFLEVSEDKKEGV